MEDSPDKDPFSFITFMKAAPGGGRVRESKPEEDLSSGIKYLRGCLRPVPESCFWIVYEECQETEQKFSLSSRHMESIPLRPKVPLSQTLQDSAEAWGLEGCPSQSWGHRLHLCLHLCLILGPEDDVQLCSEVLIRRQA